MLSPTRVGRGGHGGRVQPGGQLCGGITMPLAAPGMAAIFLLTFVGVWNEFFAGYLLITKNKLKPVMFGMYDFLGQNLINAQLVAAACVLVVVPIVIRLSPGPQDLLPGNGGRRDQRLRPRLNPRMGIKSYVDRKLSPSLH